MPNHETNHVIVIAREDDITRLRREACIIGPTGVPVLDFGKVIPQPEEIKASHDTPGANPPWYRWCIDNWGTKWGAYSPTVFTIEEVVGYRDYPEDTPHTERVRYSMLTMVFETAWSQPTPILAKLAGEYDAYVEAVTFDEGGFDDVHYQSDETVDSLLMVTKSAESYDAKFFARHHLMPKAVS